MIFLSLGNSSSPGRYSHQYWAPVVANHFPPTSPFVQGQNLGYSLLPQGVQFSPPPRAPTLSQMSTARQRSGGAGGDYTLLPQTPKLERKRSKKGAREVRLISFPVQGCELISLREKYNRSPSASTHTRSHIHIHTRMYAHHCTLKITF